jgi:S-DNA-T family DNA segregation ATPase FtsK/SpoIIIE
MPLCDVTGPDGSRMTIHPHSANDSVADLARALDLPIDMPLSIDGRSVAGHERLVASGLRIGSVITEVRCASAGADRHPAADGLGSRIDVAVGAGPACGRWITLGPGRHTVGRAPSADVLVDDPTVEPHHAVIDVDVDGIATFTQLTGTIPVTVDGTPAATRQRIEPGQVVRFGSSRLELRATARAPRGQGSVVPSNEDPWRHVVRRGPTPPPRPATPPLAVPDPPATHRAPPLTSLVGAGVAAAGAGLMAAVLGQALFALFACVGAVASVSTWAVGATVAWRARRRAGAAHRTALAHVTNALHLARADTEAAHRERHRTVVDALEVVHGAIGHVWSRRCSSGDALLATIGRGACRWQLPFAPEERRRLDGELLVDVEACERLDDVPVPLLLEPSGVVAIRGGADQTAALARSVIVQLAVSYGPADWAPVIVTGDRDAWNWVDWLPHARCRPAVVDAADPSAIATGLDVGGPADGANRRLVIVLDAPDLLTARTGPVRRRLERGDASCIVMVAADATVPGITRRVLEVGVTGAARWCGPATAEDPSGESSWESADRDIHVAGISPATAEEAARRLAPLVDPEDQDDTAGVPASVSLAELEVPGADAAGAIARRWRRVGRDPAPIAQLGRSGDGIVDIDLVRDGPHGLIAGTTGSGKSELLRTLVVALAAGVSPDHLTMILVDFKGGSTFDACARLPHTVGVVTDLDDSLAERMLVSLDAEVRRRERVLRVAGAESLSAYRCSVDDPMPRLLVVVDEFASLAQAHPEFLGALVSVAQRGRSLGIHLLLATQRPAGVVTDDIRANTNLRVALRLQDRSDALDVVGDGSPAEFPPGIPGRAAMRLGPDELVVFQTATSSAPWATGSGRLRVERHAHGWSVTEPPADGGPTVLERLVAAIDEAARTCGIANPHRPWIDPLPTIVRRCDLGPGALGMVDDPAGQRRDELRWSPTDGTLLVVGAVGAGTTTAAATVAVSCLHRAEPADLQLYVIDAQGDTAWTPFATTDHCGAVVRLGEVERLDRLLRRLADEIDRRSDEGARSPSIVVMIDGLAAVRDALDDHHTASRRFDRILRDGPAVGIVAVITTDGSSASALACARSVTWVLHVDDPAIARSAGLRTTPVVAGIPGRLRIVGSGLEAQVAVDATRPEVPRRPGRGGPPPIEVLAEVIDPDTLVDPADRLTGGAQIDLVVGMGADDLEPAVLRVPAGDHVFIGGAARTGRSTALRRIEAAWRRRRPDGVVIIIGGPGCTGDALDRVDAADDRPVLVVADDAERIEDPDGRLAALVSSHRPGVTVAAAARLEAVRVAYGHWTRAVARSRCGMVLTSVGDLDGELLGATLPRRTIIPPRPGLAWVIDLDGHRLVQVAARMRT